MVWFDRKKDKKAPVADNLIVDIGTLREAVFDVADDSARQALLRILSDLREEFDAKPPSSEIYCNAIGDSEDSAQPTKVDELKALIKQLRAENKLSDADIERFPALDKRWSVTEFPRNTEKAVPPAPAKKTPPSKPVIGRRGILRMITGAAVVVGGIGTTVLDEQNTGVSFWKGSRPDTDTTDQIIRLANNYLKQRKNNDSALPDSLIEQDLVFLSDIRSEVSIAQGIAAREEEMKAFVPVLRQAVDEGAGALVQLFATYYPDYLSKSCIGETKTRAVNLPDYVKGHYAEKSDGRADIPKEDLLQALDQLRSQGASR